MSAISHVAEIESFGPCMCEPVHDAILIKAPPNKIEDHVRRATSLMQRTMEWMLGCGMNAVLAN